MTNIVFMEFHEATVIDQGGPCGHTSPDGMFDDCLCRDGWCVGAYISDGRSADYCDGRSHEPAPPF